MYAIRSYYAFTTIQSLLNELPKNCLKIFDINLRQAFYTKDILEISLQKCDILKLNEDELPVVAKIFGLDGESYNFV